MSLNLLRQLLHSLLVYSMQSRTDYIGNKQTEHRDSDDTTDSHCLVTWNWEKGVFICSWLNKKKWEINFYFICRKSINAIRSNGATILNLNKLKSKYISYLIGTTVAIENCVTYLLRWQHFCCESVSALDYKNSFSVWAENKHITYVAFCHCWIASEHRASVFGKWSWGSFRGSKRS